MQVRAYNDHYDDDTGADDEVPEEAEPPVRKGSERRPEKIISRYKSRKINREVEVIVISDSDGDDEGADDEQAEPSLKGNKVNTSLYIVKFELI